MNALTLMLAAIAPAAPVHDTAFWDGNWRHVQRANAVYYGWNTPLDSGRCRIQDFYRSGEHQMEAVGWLGPPVEKDGAVTYFFRSGPKSTTSRFVNGKREGEWRYWNEDGTLRRKTAWHADYKIIATYTILADDAKVPQLVEQMPKFLGLLPLAQYLGATIAARLACPRAAARSSCSLWWARRATLPARALSRASTPPATPRPYALSSPFFH